MVQLTSKFLLYAVDCCHPRHSWLHEFLFSVQQRGLSSKIHDKKYRNFFMVSMPTSLTGPILFLPEARIQVENQVKMGPKEHKANERKQCIMPRV